MSQKDRIPPVIVKVTLPKELVGGNRPKLGKAIAANIMDEILIVQKGVDQCSFDLSFDLDW